MQIRTATLKQLTSEEVAAWNSIQRDEPELASPFFRPEFAQAVGSVRDDVEVAILEDAGRSFGFFPYQRSRWNSGRPVGSVLSDYHGLIAPARVGCDPTELLRGCGLNVLHFDHLIDASTSFAPFTWRQSDSWHIDVPETIDDYFAGRENGRSLKSEYGQKVRKLAREVGPVRYVAHSADPELLSTLVAWKTAQYRRTNVANVFGYAWVRDLLDKLMEYDSLDFSPAVSALYAGDTIASIHYGMRSRTLLHGWFPAYNVALARYSPGMLHWLETIRSAKSAGIHRIDLAAGRESYKQRLVTGATQTAQGTVDVRASTRAVRRAWWTARDHFRGSQLAAAGSVPAEIMFRVRHWLDAR
jgi:CelD/BcsL family acetyltransferase involved in cellulose biosynthesis